MSRPVAVTGDKWAMQFLKALGLDGARSRRLVIDCTVGEVMRVYVEYIGDERAFEVYPPDPAEVEIVVGAPQEEMPA